MRSEAYVASSCCFGTCGTYQLVMTYESATKIVPTKELTINISCGNIPETQQHADEFFIIDG